jgi:hypothetical protein
MKPGEQSCGMTQHTYRVAGKYIAIPEFYVLTPYILFTLRRCINYWVYVRRVYDNEQ